MRVTRSRIGAVIEVGLCFALMVGLFRFLLASDLSLWEADLRLGSHLLFVEYGGVLIAVLAWLVATRRPLKGYGLTLGDESRSLHVLIVGLLPMLALGGVLGWVDWTTWWGALAVSAFEIILLVGIGWLLREEGEEDPTPLVTGLLVLIPWIGFGVERGILSGMLLKTLYHYGLVAPAEELLFRGYMQTRLNQAFGTPYEYFGARWGWGVFIASFLFGLWHVVLAPDVLQAWPHGLWTLFAGLILGYLRERSDGLLAPSILHSVMNYVPLFG